MIQFQPAMNSILRPLAVLLALLILLPAALGMSPMIVGKWRLKLGAESKVNANIQFRSNMTGTMTMAGGAKEEIQFRYFISGDTLSMRATKFTRNGKKQKPPTSKIVLRITWKSKDRIEAQEIQKGSVKERKDVLIRVK